MEIQTTLEQRLIDFIEQFDLEAEHLTFGQSCHSVEEAAIAANASVEDFVKNICLVDDANRLIVAIAKGEDRVSTSRIGKALGIQRPRIATPDEVLRLSGYPVGGVPSFGYPALFLIDTHVMERSVIYTGGGSTTSLVKISPQELHRANQGQILRLRK